MKKKIVVLASGAGTNFAALREYIRKKKLNAEIIELLSDNPTSNALLLAVSFKIPRTVIPKAKENREEYNKNLLEKLKILDPDLIVCAGYMKILPSEIIREFPKKIINIHPSLLPAFPGINSIKKAWDYGVKVTGCTTHFVDETVDGGEIILQSEVKITSEMTETGLTERIHKEEHKILPKSVQLFIEGKLEIKNRRVIIKET
ncbi:MAG: phosphoribosylglycinamide formyltransferase [Leptospiraceae bacterium]|nr:phosphoribosylglycinamide formyltransferase [Leptospiraceae bacterium]